MPKRETGEVSNWFKPRGYGFVTREGRESSFASDIQLHTANAKGARLKEYLKQHGLMLGAKIRYTVDFEENKGKAYAAQWELVDAPDFSQSRSRSRPGRARRSPSYGGRGPKRRSPSVKRGRSRRSPSVKRTRKSPSYGRPARRSPSYGGGAAKRKASPSPGSGDKDSPEKKSKSKSDGRKKAKRRSPSKSPSAKKRPSSDASRSRSRSRSKKAARKK